MGSCAAGTADCPPPILRESNRECFRTHSTGESNPHCVPTQVKTPVDVHSHDDDIIPGFVITSSHYYVSCVKRVEGLGTKLCSWATCAIIIIYPTWLVLCCYYCKHICTCASVYSNFNIIYTQLCIKSALYSISIVMQLHLCVTLKFVSHVKIFLFYTQI